MSADNEPSDPDKFAARALEADCFNAAEDLYSLAVELRDVSQTHEARSRLWPSPANLAVSRRACADLRAILEYLKEA